MGRVFRSDFFNIIVHRRQVAPFKKSPAEDRVMIGASNRYERKLLQRSIARGREEKGTVLGKSHFQFVHAV